MRFGSVIIAASMIIAGQGAFAPVLAKDLGVVGELFDITEPNLLVELYKRFDQLEREGAVEALREASWPAPCSGPRRQAPTGGRAPSAGRLGIAHRADVLRTADW